MCLGILAEAEKKLGYKCYEANSNKISMTNEDLECLKYMDEGHSPKGCSVFTEKETSHSHSNSISSKSWGLKDQTWSGSIFVEM